MLVTSAEATAMAGSDLREPKKVRAGAAAESADSGVEPVIMELVRADMAKPRAALLDATGAPGAAATVS